MVPSPSIFRTMCFSSKCNLCGSFHSVHLDVGSGTEPFDIPEEFRFFPLKKKGQNISPLLRKEKQCFKTEKESKF